MKAKAIILTIITVLGLSVVGTSIEASTGAEPSFAQKNHETKAQIKKYKSSAKKLFIKSQTYSMKGATYNIEYIKDGKSMVILNHEMMFMVNAKTKKVYFFDQTKYHNLAKKIKGHGKTEQARALSRVEKLYTVRAVDRAAGLGFKIVKKTKSGVVYVNLYDRSSKTNFQSFIVKNGNVYCQGHYTKRLYRID